MNFRAKIFGAIAMVISTLSAGSANATIVNYTGTFVNMGNVLPSQQGEIFDNLVSLHAGPLFFSTAGANYGYLAAGQTITFDFSFAPGTLIVGSSSMSGNYSYVDGGNTYSGSANATSGGGNSSNGTINGFASSPLALASANVTVDHAQTQITNLSGGWLYFSTLFSGLLTSTTGFTLTYYVSQVPLPAGMPMLLLALAGMFAFAYNRKKNASFAA